MDDDNEKLVPEGRIPARYEASYLNLWTILLALLGLVVAIVIVLILAAGLFGFYTAQTGSPQPFSPFVIDAEGLTPLEIEQRIDAPQEREQLYAAQEERISSYAWLDRESGIAAIPIERAMEIIAQQGLPDFGDGEFAIPEPLDPTDPDALAQAGERLFQEFGCVGCHIETDTPVAPTLRGVYGNERELTTGETILADESYIETSILDPDLHVVAGYQPIMPNYEGRLSQDQLDAMIAYIVSLGE
jgi:mono/diheme cytochrome c family protein